MPGLFGGEVAAVADRPSESGVQALYRVCIGYEMRDAPSVTLAEASRVLVVGFGVFRRNS